MEEPPLEQVDMPWKKKSPCHSRLLAGSLGCGEELMQEQVFWQELPLVGPTLELPDSEGLYPMERSHAGAAGKF